MSGWTNIEEQDILEWLFAGTTRPNLATHVSLFTTTPAEDGTGGIEASWTGYARQPFAPSVANWGPASGNNPMVLSNLSPLTFPENTSGSGTVLSWGYHTAVVGGLLLFVGVLDVSKAIVVNDIPQFDAGEMAAKLGDPGDTY